MSRARRFSVDVLVLAAATVAAAADAAGSPGSGVLPRPTAAEPPQRVVVFEEFSRPT